MADHDDIKGMSDQQLMDEWTALGAEVEEQKARLRAFSAEHQERTDRARLQSVLGDMTEEERDRMAALVQSMEPVNVESEEAVMTGEDD